MSEVQSNISNIKNFKVYKWNFTCYRCHAEIPVASYYFYHEHFHAIGDVQKLDVELKNIYPFIEEKYDKTLGKDIITNYCLLCGLIIDNMFIAQKVGRILISKDLQNFEDTSIPNYLTLKDLNTNVYEQYGLDSRQANVLRDIEKILGFRLFPTKHITNYLPRIMITGDQLVGLGLSKCNLHSVPESICNLIYLKKLNLSWNRIKSIPKCLKKLENLEVLDISRNPLFPFPEVIPLLSSLKELRLHITSIRKVPNLIGNLTSLKKLYISGFAIRKIPDSIGNLKSLEELRLKPSRLRTLPESISNLKSLKKFEFDYNETMDIPESVLLLYKKLQKPKPKRLIKLKKIYSDDVEVRFIKIDPKLRFIDNTKIQRDPKLFKDNNKIQREETHKWEWEDTKWERLNEDIIFPYDEIYVIPSVEANKSLNDSPPKWLHIKRKGGIRVKDLKEAYYNKLPDYGDYHFFESFEYMYDYNDIPVYYLFIGS